MLRQTKTNTQNRWIVFINVTQERSVAGGGDDDDDEEEKNSSSSGRYAFDALHLPLSLPLD